MKKMKHQEYEKLKRRLQKIPFVPGLRYPLIADRISGRKQAALHPDQGVYKAYAEVKALYCSDYLSRIQADTEIWMQKQERMILSCREKLNEPDPYAGCSYYDISDSHLRRKILQAQAQRHECRILLYTLQLEKENIETLLEDHKNRAEAVLKRHLKEYRSGVRSADGRIPEELLEDPLCKGSVKKEETEKKEKGDLQWQPMN